MLIEQIYTGCLSQGAYYIESNGEAAIIDPLREPTPYLQRAARSGAKIKYILETHFHADFVSGHLDLHRKTGAEIVYGPNAEAAFPFHLAYDGEELPLGRCTIKVMHTPGHTMESVCYLLKDEKGHENALFTGDTLFINDVGRPDLAQKIDASLTPEMLAGHLYDSLRNKIMPLRDNILIYPGHGAGSACGKNLGDARYDTLYGQKRHNYALQPDLSKSEFIQRVTSGLPAPPAYFPMNVRMNKKGYEPFEKVMARGYDPLEPTEFKAIARETGAILLDARNPEAFAAGHIPGSINIGIDGNFAPLAGALIPDPEEPILIVAEEGRQKEVITRLARVGLDLCLGYLQGGIESWKAAGKKTDRIRSVTALELAEVLRLAPVHIVDVRSPREFEDSHVLGAENMPLESINQQMNRLDRHKTYYIYCGGGYRSVTFISILKARGFNYLINVMEGFRSIRSSAAICITNDVTSSWSLPVK